jgi:chromosomal replication initiation ATPase DnaA
MKPPLQLALDLQFKPIYSLEDFIKAPSNWEALSWIQKWPDWPVTFINLWGESGSGKSHLAHIWHQLSSASFIERSKITIWSPQEICDLNTCFIFEDLDEISDEEWLLHFYNLAKEKNSFVLFTSKRPVTQWGIKLPDLKSRLATVLSVELKNLDDESLKIILIRLLEIRGLTLSAESADYILKRVERSFIGVKEIVSMIDQYALAFKRQPSHTMVRHIIQSYLNRMTFE